MTVDDVAAAAAAGAWSLPDLAEDLRTHRRRLRATRPARDPVRSFARLARTLQPALIDLARQLGLPAEILPPHWPGSRLGEDIAAFARPFGPSLTSYLAELQVR